MRKEYNDILELNYLADVKTYSGHIKYVYLKNER